MFLIFDTYLSSDDWREWTEKQRKNRFSEIIEREKAKPPRFNVGKLRIELAKVTPKQNDYDNLDLAIGFIKTHVMPTDAPAFKISAFMESEILKHFDLKGDLKKALKAAISPELKQLHKSEEPENPDQPEITASDLDYMSGRNLIFNILATEFIKDNDIISLPNGIHVYQDGIYITSEYVTASIKLEIHTRAAEMGIPLSDQQLDAIVKLIETQTAKRLEDCEPDIDHVTLFNDGIFDISTMELKPFDPEKIYFSKIPVDYIPNAQAPLWEKYLKTTFSGNENDLRIAQELFGYCLARHHKLQYLFYLLGDGGNGKGTFIYVLGELLGIKNITSSSIHDLTGDKSEYHIAQTFGKMANICGDVGYSTIKNTEIIKKLTSGTDPVTGRHPYGRPFQFLSFLKLIFALNRLPKKPSFTRGDKRRDVIVNFKNTIGNTSGDIKGFHNLIVEAGELPGILNWALEGLKRLQEQGDFSIEKSISKRALDYEKKSHPIRFFVEDCIDEMTGEEIEKAKVEGRIEGITTEGTYEAYENYRKIDGLPEMNSQDIKFHLINELREIGIDTYVKRKKIRMFNGKVWRPHVFMGVKLRTEK